MFEYTQAACRRCGGDRAWKPVPGVACPGPAVELLKMKDIETQEKFIALRSRGHTFASIAAELGVARGTLINWSRKFQYQINNLRAVELEALQEQLIASREHRARLRAAELQRVETELQSRELTGLSTAALFQLARSLRTQIQRETGTISFTSPLKEIPEDEYHEQVQQWAP